MQTQTVETLEKELEDANTRINELETESTDKGYEIETLEKKVLELEREVQDLENITDPKHPFPSETMYDDMKRDYLLEIWEHYTPQEIEAALPRR